MRISDWSSDVCSSDLRSGPGAGSAPAPQSRRHLSWRSLVGGVVARGGGHHVWPGRSGIVQQVVGQGCVLHDRGTGEQIGSATGRARARQYVQISVVAVLFTNKQTTQHNTPINT